MNPSFFTRLHDSPHITLILLLLSTVVAFAANLFGLAAGVSIVIPHLFYIPIILAAFFYPRRGILFSVLLSASYLAMVLALRIGNDQDILSAAARCVVFIIIAAVVSSLAEQVRNREEAIRHAKDEWERTFDAVPDLIALIGRDHRILRVNRAMAERLGLSPDQAIGLKCFEAVHNASGPPPDCPHAMLLKDGAGHAGEIHENTLGGDFLVTTSPLHDAGGSLIGSVHIARDITERKRIETALRQSEERLQLQSRDLALRARELNCLYEIGRFVETAASTGELLQDIADILPSAWRYPELTSARVVTGTAEFRSAAFAESSHRKEAPIIVYGKITGTIGIFFREDAAAAERLLPARETDFLSAVAERTGRILERKAAEEALKESEEKYRTLVESSFDGIAIHQNGTIVYVNRTAARLLGSDNPDDFTGRPALDIVAPAFREQIAERISQAPGRPLGLMREQFLRLDGTPIDVDVTTAPSIWKGAPAAYVTFRDITAQVQAEEGLKNALKKLNMLGSITRHDILNQVTALRTFLDLSREDLKGTKYADYIEREDGAAAAIQRQIEFTRYYQDIGVNAPKWQDVREVIHEAASQLSIPPAGLRIDISGIEIFADPLIVKVFFNLMENSLRHGERVTVMEFAAQREAPVLVITYRDNGVGISAEDKKKLFQKGFGKHTGLGLFLSREILAITGITIAENGEPGRGVRFAMTVPAGGFRSIAPS